MPSTPPNRPRKRAITEHDRDAPRLEDVELFSDATRRCPECGTDVYDEAEVCYKCGHAFGATGSAQAKPWVVWVILIVVLAILVPVFLRIF
jgi:predicted nucleic acid-binding Zn ribbon protein